MSKELARWRASEADPCVEWLWSLPLVTARMFAYVLDDEDDHSLAVTVGLSPAPAIDLFAPTLLTSLEKISPEGVADGLRYADLPALVRLERENLNDKSRQVGTSLLGRFQKDAEDIRSAGATDEEVETRAAQNFRTELRRRAVAAHRRLHASSRSYRGLNLAEGHVQDPFVDQYQTNPRALPMTRAIEAFSNGFAKAARASKGGKKRRKKAGSAMIDYMHMALGAAYCDIFTCDAETSEWLGTTRRDVGLPEQIVLGGSTSFEDFVNKLETALPI